MCEEDTPDMFLKVRSICLLLRLQRGSGCGCCGCRRVLVRHQLVNSIQAATKCSAGVSNIC